MRNVTIRDVAREADVSVATVSNVLNNPAIVRPETREAVMSAIEKLDYIPNENGKRLRASESRHIGLFVKAILGQYFSTLAHTLYQSCQQAGYDLEINMTDDPQRVLQVLRNGSLDGAVVFFDGMEESVRDQLLQSGYAIVFLDSDRIGEHCSSILLDNEAVGRMAAEYLVGLGMRRMLHMSGFDDNFDAIQRKEAFLSTLDTLGIPRAQVPVLQGKFERAVAFREMRRYLEEGNPPPDAIFAGNDLSAIGCISALNEAGLRVPEDVSVLGCDDITIADYFSPPLTTIRTNFNRLGTLAAGEIIRLIQGQPGQRIIQQSQLIVRKSCKPCPDIHEINWEERA